MLHKPAPAGGFRSTEEAGNPIGQLIAVTFRVEPARVQFAAQPGQLALGQLAGGEDAPVAQLRAAERAIEVLLKTQR